MTFTTYYLPAAYEDDVQEERSGTGNSVLRESGQSHRQGPSVPCEQTARICDRAAEKHGALQVVVLFVNVASCV